MGKEDEAITTGGSASKQPVPGLEFEGHEPVESEKVRQLRKAGEEQIEEANRLADEDRRREAAKTPEGRLRQKQWEEYQATKKQEQEEAERTHARLVEEARIQYKLRQVAALETLKVNEDSKEFQEILKHVFDVYNLIQDHYFKR